MRNHLVSASGDIEAVNIISAKHCRKIRAHILEVQAERSDLIVIEHDFRLRLVDLCVDDRREEKPLAFHRLGLDLIRKFQHALRLFG